MEPGHPDLERELASTLYLSRDYGAVVDLAPRLLRQHPEDPELNWFLGECLLALQKADQALEPLKKAVASQADLLPAHLALGRAYMQIGQDAAAAPHLKAALALDEDGSIHYQLGQAYRSTGQTELARQTLAESQRMQREAQARQRESQQDVQITAP
jgi:predicted Zn-dependent protease